VSHEPRIQQLHEDFARLGCKPFHVPLGIMLNEGDPRSRCIRCNTCDGYPCLVNAKSDAHICAIEPALEYPNLTLLTDAFVSRLETSASGQEVTAVHVTRNGAESRSTVRETSSCRTSPTTLSRTSGYKQSCKT